MKLKSGIDTVLDLIGQHSSISQPLSVLDFYRCQRGITKSELSTIVEMRYDIGRLCEPRINM